MGYPDYPNNRLIVDGVDLTQKFKMVLGDGYTLSPPEPKIYTVDIPGGYGKLDLTDSLLGDAAYDNREQEFTFYLINVSNFEKAKTEISNFLHGKAYDYEITMDPGYTYHGRFKVTEYSRSVFSNGVVGAIKVKVDANPFKMKAPHVEKIDAIGGKIVQLESGRMRVRPVVETDGLVKVIYDNKLLTLPQGTWTLNEITFSEGLNELYFNSFDIRNLTWGDLKTNLVTWKQFGEKRIFEWYKSNGDGTYVVMTWFNASSNTWEDFSEKTWADVTYKTDITSIIRNVYVKYDWGDL